MLRRLVDWLVVHLEALVDDTVLYGAENVHFALFGGDRLLACDEHAALRLFSGSQGVLYRVADVLCGLREIRIAHDAYLRSEIRFYSVDLHRL